MCVARRLPAWPPWTRTHRRALSSAWRAAQPGCHLHGSMRGHVFVTDSAWTLKTDESGVARFEGLPAGKVELRVWHPELLVEPPRQALQLGATTLQQTVQLGVVPRRRRL